MCGFAGIFAPGRYDQGELDSQVRDMADAMRHRGPDDFGAWVQADPGVAFSFRRLAIQDVSSSGHQPMVAGSGRYVVCFNGEIYNFRDLRSELEQRGFRFRGGSDTEVVLTCFDAWGVRESLQRFNGMFALAVWDHQERKLILVRDRLGIKPLHIRRLPGGVAFASELRALLAIPGVRNELDPAAAAAFLQTLYVPAPSTIIKGIGKLLPGHVAEFTESCPDAADPEPWWSAESVALQGLAEPFEGTEGEAVGQLDVLLRKVVSRHMISDVPLGAFLSAGIDSSTVVALMQATADRPVRTFSVSFDHAEHDESAAAAKIADYLGTDHAEVRLDGQRALDLIPVLPEILDEPHADASQVPLYLLCATARGEVTVALSGDGGDEVFGGYNRYRYGERLFTRLEPWPLPLRRGLSHLIRTASPDRWDRALRGVRRISGGVPTQRLFGEKMLKLAGVLEAESEADMYRTVVAAWPPGDRLMSEGSGVDPRSDRVLRDPRYGGLFHRMVLADQLGYLPDDQLAKVDRVSMATSLEVRVPLLDHEVVEYAWRLPKEMKRRDGRGKWVLRQVLARYVPEGLVDRPKMGLSVPLAEWLAGPLRPWAEELLGAECLSGSGIDPRPVRSAWDALLHGRSEYALKIWSVLMLQSWLDRWL